MSRDREKVARVGSGEMRVVSEKYNKLVRRVEVEAVVSHQGQPTPSRRALAEALSRIYARSVELVVVRRVETEYGVGVTKVYAHVYEDLDRLKSFEPEHILKRHGAGV
ncbi:MAG: 30S ribosomal protein S24e [Sulfolobales archaeon]|nr:30S ribosomal protein S24e [Sulfolobales archaeon]MCX8209043.1 30S ribosomal protein S24e [Sulfolobales archaeon]MDW8010074.1 30S ribosomal protein S24e [Sulfolobales archaeon]